MNAQRQAATGKQSSSALLDHQEGHKQDDNQAVLALLDNIKTLGALLDDLEQVRKANGNRIGASERRLGGTFPHLTAAQERVLAVEHESELDLKRFWRKHPLAPWAAAIPGCGEKTIARLIAVIGEPSIRAIGHWEKTVDDREWVIDGYEERTRSQLLAYCGHGNPALSVLPRNATQEELFKRGNPEAKMRTYLIGQGFIKLDGKDDSNGRARPRSPYRDVYDQWREKYEGHLHERECVRCGPSGHPAKAGSEWSKAHQHAAACRNMMKVFLEDLWAESRRLRGVED